MYAIKIIPNKRKMDDWFLYRDPDELVVQCWNEKEDAENFKLYQFLIQSYVIHFSIRS